MSVAQFSPVLRQKIIELYSDSSNKVDLANFGPKTRKQLFKLAPDTKDIRKRFEASDFHTSSITLDGMTALTSRLITVLEDKSTKDIIESFFNSANFFTDFVAYVEQKELVLEYGSGDFRVENTPQDNLKKHFLNYLKENVTGVSADTFATINKNIQSGHLAGVFFLKLKTALGIRAKFSKSAEASYRDFSISLDGLPDDSKAVAALDAVLKAVLDADYLTSNLITNSQVFIDATKTVLGDSPSLITELQFAADNKAAGDLLQQTGKKLNQLIAAASRSESGPTEEAIAGLVASLKPVVDLINQKVEQLKEPLSRQGLYDKIKANAQFLANDLINTPGSVTIKQGIADTLVNVLKTGKILPKQVSRIRPKPIIQKHKEVLDISKVASDFAKNARTLKKAIAKKKISKRVSAVSSNTGTNLTSLQTLLNGNLQEQIRRNMGTGNSRDVLNYRTGRFAESVQVERLSESRAGMITAFYSYMKNPYATFSAGGRQQTPKSRDPKLLIARSIREIAQTQVGNRLRSVNV
jgi:hypothetical protein